MKKLIALLLALMRLSKNKVIRGISGAYIAVFRSTPLLVQLSIIYFGLFGIIKIPSYHVPDGTDSIQEAITLN